MRRVAYGGMFLGALAGLTLVHPAPPAPARAPTRLGDPACELPAEAAGAVGHVLVQYRVTETGLVDQARSVYAVVRPESARNTFVTSLEACVAGWRYRPARSGGRPVAEHLLAAFHVFDPAPAGAPRVAIPGGRTMPVEQLAQLRREKQSLAMFLLGGADFHRIAGDGYELRSDLPGDGARALASAITRAGEAFQAAFPAAPAAPAGDRIVLHVFGRQEEFNQVVAFDELSLTHVPLAGQYAPEGGLVYLSAGGKPARLAARVVAHEVTHHLVHGRLYGGTRTPPFWVTEGIASFIENLPGMDGTASGPVDLGTLDRGLKNDEGYTWRADPDRYLDEMDRADDTGGMASISELMAWRGSSGGERTLAYAQSWLLVHFLMNADAGRYREAFRRWLAGPDADKDGAALREALGMSSDALGALLDAHRVELERPTRPSRGSVR